MAIPVAEFGRRRAALMAQMEAASIAVVPAAKPCVRNRDVDYRFRQDSDFWYLTGHIEPNAVLALMPGRQQGEAVLFCDERDPERELWEGKRLGPEGAVSQLGFDDAFPIGDIDDILPGLLEGKSKVYYALGKQAEFDSRMMAWLNAIRARVRTGAVPPGEFADLELYLHELRLIKSPAEIKQMAAAAAISATAHKRAMRVCQPGMYEYQLEAELLHEFHCGGAEDCAYPAIVGGGSNACILHYINNRDKLPAGALVLIDAGCELNGYAADISRTFPVSGTFNAEQKALYEVVLQAQLAAINCIRPGRRWNEAHDVTVRIITEGLVELGLLSGRPQALIAAGAYQPFYMHRAGHWLGMDVHDVGNYKINGQWRELQPGMVLTVEPGIYIAPDNKTVKPRWRGIGIRIEDNVAVTRAAPKVLTAAVPKTVADIEALMAAT